MIEDLAELSVDLVSRLKQKEYRFIIVAVGLEVPFEVHVVASVSPKLIDLVFKEIAKNDLRKEMVYD